MGPLLNALRTDRGRASTRSGVSYAFRPAARRSPSGTDELGPLQSRFATYLPVGYADRMARMGPTRSRDSRGLAADLLKLARAKAGVTQARLAALAGVPRSTVERIEAGTR